MRKKILVLGATGFIGRNVAEYFGQSADLEVYGTYFRSPPLDHPNIQMLSTDLTNREQVDLAIKGKDVVVIAAAITSGARDTINNPHIHIADTSVMNSLILRSVYENETPNIFFLSCSIVYQSSEHPLKESDFDASQELHPNYFGPGWGKIYFEKMCEFYSRLGKNKFTVFRHSNNYGPYDKFDLEKSHVFGATVAKVMAAQNGKVLVWGTGEEERDLLYIADLVCAVEAALKRQKTQFEIFNIGLGRTIAVKDLVQKIIDCSQRDLVIEHDLSKPSIKTQFCLDCTKAKETLNWEPQVPLDEGVEKTMRWYRDNQK